MRQERPRQLDQPQEQARLHLRGHPQMDRRRRPQVQIIFPLPLLPLRVEDTEHTTSEGNLLPKLSYNRRSSEVHIGRPPHDPTTAVAVPTAAASCLDPDLEAVVAAVTMLLLPHRNAENRRKIRYSHQCPRQESK